MIVGRVQAGWPAALEDLVGGENEETAARV